MEDGPHGLSGLNAVPPVAQVVVAEAESVMTHHHNMGGTTALVVTIKSPPAIHNHVLVSLLAKEALPIFGTVSLLWISLTTCQKKALCRQMSHFVNLVQILCILG